MFLTRNKVSSLFILIIILLLLSISVSSLLSFRLMEKGTNNIVAHAIPLGYAEDDLLTQMINEETGVRGFLVTQDAKFLDPYFQGKEKIKADLTEIRKHEIEFPIIGKTEYDDSLQQINTIEYYFENQISLIKSGEIVKAQNNINEGKHLMDTYRQMNQKMKSSIANVTESAWDSSKKVSTISRIIIIIGNFLTILIGLLTYLLFLRARRTEKEFRKSEEQLRALFENANDAIFVFSISEDDMPSHYLQVNQIACNLLGYSRDEFLTLSPLKLTPSKRHDLIPHLMREIVTKGQMTFEGAYIAKNGFQIPFEFSTCILNFGEEKVVMSIARDISERKKSEKLMKQMAYYDHLTQLPNRRFFEESLQQAMGKIRKNNEMLAVLFLDLDGFKSINDTYGHDTGDLLLKEVSKRLLFCIREKDIVSRLAGDEFTVLLQDVTKQEALFTVQSMIDTLSQPIQIKGNQLLITSSIGITFFHRDGTDWKTLLKQADSAMYKAKQQGKNQYRMYQTTPVEASY